METHLELNDSTQVRVHPGELEGFSADDSFDFPYKIINVVALGILKLKDTESINFDELEKKISVKRLNRFPCVLFKIDNISIILFKNGKLILTGIKKRDTIPILKEQIIEHLKKGEIKFTEFEIQIQNLVVMSHLNRIVNLEMACLTLTNCLYEPEQFPAAIVKPLTGGTFLIFSNSKIIGLGMKSMDMVQNSLKTLIQDIFDYDLFIEFPNQSDFDDFEL